jgi:hypothetical protein
MFGVWRGLADTGLAGFGQPEARSRHSALPAARQLEPIAGIARTSLPESRRSAEAAFSRSSFYVFIQTKESSSSAAGGLDRC